MITSSIPASLLDVNQWPVEEYNLNLFSRGAGLRRNTSLDMQCRMWISDDDRRVAASSTW